MCNAKRLVIRTETVKLGAVQFQPAAGFLHGRDRISHEPPELWPMVHFTQVSDLMCRDVIQNKWRRKDEPP